MSGSPSSDLGGPVSTALEEELRDDVRRNGLVVWLDSSGHYTRFAERLEQSDGLGYAVRRYRGSFLELMLELEPLTGGERINLLLHVPGYNRDTIKKTPLLELYAAGKSRAKALDTVIRNAAAGQVSSEQIDTFLAAGEQSLEDADRWLASQLEAGAETGDAFAASLRLLGPRGVLGDLLAGGALARDDEALWRQWGVWVGLPAAWRESMLPPRPQPLDVAATVAGWILAVEYVHDLRRAPVSALLEGAQELARPVLETALELARQLRGGDAAFYRQAAEEAEELLADEVKAARAEDLGRIDTFRFEEDVVLDAALDALGDEAWQRVAEWAARRVGDDRKGTFWLQQDSHRRRTWELIELAAKLGLRIEEAGELPIEEGLEAAVEAYAQLGAAVDRAHRLLVERRPTLLTPELPKFDTLRRRLGAMQVHWRAWADEWSRRWNTLCRREGFLPPPALQQRELFDQVVAPLAAQGLTAYFTLDGFRFEMAAALFEQLQATPASQVKLAARLAELPTVTEVGMNVLSPVVRGGRLAPAGLEAGSDAKKKIKGFASGEFRVADRETRRRAMHGRVGGSRCPRLSLDEVTGRSVASLRRSLSQARLVLITGREADRAGENELAPWVLEDVVNKVRTAWQFLRESGVRRFVITSDHGFLLLDATARRVPIEHGRRLDPKARYVFSAVAADEDEKVRVSLAELAYDDAEGYVIFPESTAPFNARGRDKGYLHGGNSLQERVVPVLTVVHRAAAGGAAERFELVAAARSGEASMHRLEARARARDQGRLDFGALASLELALRVPEDPLVRVELFEARRGATLQDGLVKARIDEDFELLFRLVGARESRVRVELYHPGVEAEVEPVSPAARFAVTALRPPERRPVEGDVESGRPSDEPAASQVDEPPASDWLDDLPTGVRQVFAHIENHGAIVETEAAAMLGGQRGLRRFSRRFEHHAASAPFDVRIDVVAGVKRYVREGGER